MIEREPPKKTAWAMVFFYLLVGFEILYLISPFGVYSYSVYGAGLDFLGYEASARAWRKPARAKRSHLPRGRKVVAHHAAIADFAGWHALAHLGARTSCSAPSQLQCRTRPASGPVADCPENVEVLCL